MKDLFDTSDEDIEQLISRNALFIINHSGGKDSQAMLLHVAKRVPEKQILLIHAELPGVEWEGTIDHVKRYASKYPLILCKAKKTFFDMVRHRGMFPSPQYRQCTSDLKRGPIEREIRHHLKKNPQFGGLVVNCMGLRAQESANRARAEILKLSKNNSKAGREWYDWLPIHDFLEHEVFDLIAEANQEPHWAYSQGMSRLSCCFCIMSSRSDLKIAAKFNPKLYNSYLNLEKEIGFTMFANKEQPVSLETLAGVPAAA